MRRCNIRYAASAVMVAITLAACSSSSKPATPTTVTTASSPAATVSIRSTHLGDVLVNRAGMTLYLYDKDSAGTSKCANPCTTVWPPFTASGTPTYGKGVRPAMFATITRSDGAKQITVNGLPLYTYSGDRQPGDTSGQNLGDFFVAGSNGKMIGHA